MTNLELAGIPFPKVFKELSPDEIEHELIVKLKESSPELYGENLQPSDPAVSVIKAVSSALSEFRSYANEIARTQFVAWHNDTQLPRRRFGFGEEYRSRALEISLNMPDDLEGNERLKRVSKDVLVDSDREGRVILWVLSKAQNGETDLELIKEIVKILNQEDQKIKTDTIVARSAIGKAFNLKAKIWLYPTTSEQIFSGLRIRFVEAFNEFRGFGKDVNLSWVASVLHVPGVQNVDLSKTTPLEVNYNECAWLESIDIGEKAAGRQT